MSHQDYKHFDCSEMERIQSLLQEVFNIIRSKVEIPSDEDKQAYSKIPEEKKMIVSKVLKFRNDEPALSSKEIDWSAFYDSYADNLFLKSTILTIEILMKELEQTRLLHDLANYKRALEEFEYTASHKTEDLRQTSKHDTLKSYL